MMSSHEIEGCHDEVFVVKLNGYVDKRQFEDRQTDKAIPMTTVPGYCTAVLYRKTNRIILHCIQQLDDLPDDSYVLHSSVPLLFRFSHRQCRPQCQQ